MPKLKLLKGKASDGANDTANETIPSEYDKYGTVSLKKIVDPWAGRGESVVAEDSNFDYMKPKRGNGTCIDWCHQTVIA